MSYKKAVFLVAVALLASCGRKEASPTSAGTQRPMPCTDLASVKSDRTPPELYSGVIACVKQGNYENAAGLRALAGTYGFYDTLRVADPTGAQVLTGLKFGLEQATNPEEQQALMAAINRVVEDPVAHAELCRGITEVGRPTYPPTSMSSHGMAAFSGNPQVSDPTGFDPAGAWSKALEYPRCAAKG